MELLTQLQIQTSNMELLIRASDTKVMIRSYKYRASLME